MASKIISAIATVDGQEITLTENTTTGKWEATAVAPATSSFNLDGGYYGVSITAKDEAGNEATIDATDTDLGEALRLVVKEVTAPTVTVESPTAGEITSDTAKEVKFTVTDNDSGVDKDTITLTIDGTVVDGVTITEIDGGYECSYTPTWEDGEHTIAIDASDHDGNASDTAEVTFTVHAAAPELSVTSPEDGLSTNDTKVTVAGTTNGEKVTVTVNGSETELTVTDGAFSGEIDLGADGDFEITITAISDSGMETTVTRTVTVDTIAPQFSDPTITPNPVNVGSSYVISITIE